MEKVLPVPKSWKVLVRQQQQERREGGKFSLVQERERERGRKSVCYFSSSWFELAGEFLVKYQIAVNIQDIWNFHVKWIAVRRLRIWSLDFLSTLKHLTSASEDALNQKKVQGSPNKIFTLEVGL